MWDTDGFMWTKQHSMFFFFSQFPRQMSCKAYSFLSWASRVFQTHRPVRNLTATTRDVLISRHSSHLSLGEIDPIPWKSSFSLWLGRQKQARGFGNNMVGKQLHQHFWNVQKKKKKLSFLSSGHHQLLSCWFLLKISLALACVLFVAAVGEGMSCSLPTHNLTLGCATTQGGKFFSCLQNTYTGSASFLNSLTPLSWIIWLYRCASLPLPLLSLVSKSDSYVGDFTFGKPSWSDLREGGGCIVTWDSDDPSSRSLVVIQGTADGDRTNDGKKYSL